jgi:twitching motility protein PilT
MTMPITANQNTVSFIRSLQERIPTRIVGLERQRFIGEQLIDKLVDDDRETLRRLVEELLLDFHRMGASDIDLGGWGSQKQVWYRLHGAKRPMDNSPDLDADSYSIILQNLLTETQRDTLYQSRNLDFSLVVTDSTGQAYRYRADAYIEMESLAINFRVIDNKLRSIESYLFHQNILKVLNLFHTKEGLILITGITGSGKSSTLDAIIDYNNATNDGHIVIVASPIEFLHTSKRCLVRHREVGRDTMTFKSGTVEALRQDPDIIVIGEMRDPETILAALEAADSGHKVISTLHTSSSVESIERIIAEVPPREQDRVRMRLASVLKCVISQKLVPTVTGELTLAREIMLTLPSIQAAIRNNNSEEIYQMIGEGGKFGMCTMEQHLKYLYSIKKITLQSAENFANNKRMILQLLQAA